MNDRLLAALISFLAGATSLGQETLWIRLLSFAGDNSPQSIGIVLAIFLIGIVAGSILGKRLCALSPDKSDLKRYMAVTLIATGGIDVLAPYALTAMDNPIFVPLAMLGFTFLTASSKAVLFPIVHHVGSRMQEGWTGKSIAWIYFMNILGATLSPLLISFWLLDHAGSVQIMQAMGLISLTSGMLVAAFTMPGRTIRRIAFPVLAAAILLWMLPPRTDLIQRLAYGSDITSIPFLLENRHGIIHTTRNPLKGDGVFGANLYDGRINIDPYRNSNGITRAYLLATLHPNPRRILEIGLSGGAWARVLAALPGVERIDIVEINPGYLELINVYDMVRPVLNDPKIHIHIDDGRRWLRRYRGEPFDLIVINASYHWRAFATNVLSHEFLQLVSRHLAPGGIYAFNATGSPDVLFTAAVEFPHAYQWSPSHFVYAAHHDFRHPDPVIGARRLRSTLKALGFGEDRPGTETLFRSLTHPRWVDAHARMEAAGRPLERITDDNLITEYRYGRRRFWPF